MVNGWSAVAVVMLTTLEPIAEGFVPRLLQDLPSMWQTSTRLLNCSRCCKPPRLVRAGPGNPARSAPAPSGPTSSGFASSAIRSKRAPVSAVGTASVTEPPCPRCCLTTRRWSRLPSRSYRRRRRRHRHRRGFLASARQARAAAAISAAPSNRRNAGRNRQRSRAGPTVDSAVLSAIAGAVRASERLRFDYVDHAGNQTVRTVEPQRLVVWGSRWYLLAWDMDRDDWRTFRVDPDHAQDTDRPPIQGTDAERRGGDQPGAAFRR